MHKPQSVLFLTLRVFSATGGIEKVCRILGKALYENSLEFNWQVKIASMYDAAGDALENPYFPNEIFEGFGIKKFKFSRAMMLEGKGYHTVIISHINLLPVAYSIKRLNPKTKIILLAHGIEVWSLHNHVIEKMLKSCDEIFAVSRYTKEKMTAVHGIDEVKIRILNNCLDPLTKSPKKKGDFSSLRNQYRIGENDIVLMTLSRLSSKERYKGYDKVMMALAKEEFKNLPIRYLLAGRYDAEEKQYLEKIAADNGLEETLIMPGFIADSELEDHFQMADLYIMPSRKEGFGIVFVEAMFYGLPVIAGNADGSTDALLDGKLGRLVDPENVDEIATAISCWLNNRNEVNEDIPRLLKENFSYEAYKSKLNDYLLDGVRYF